MTEEEARKTLCPIFSIGCFIKTDTTAMSHDYCNCLASKCQLWTWTYTVKPTRFSMIIGKHTAFEEIPTEEWLGQCGLKARKE